MQVMFTPLHHLFCHLPVLPFPAGFITLSLAPLPPPPHVLNLSTSILVTEKQTDVNLNMQQIKWCRSLNIWATPN